MLALALFGSLGASAAEAATSHYGTSVYSQDVNSGTRVRVRDASADSHPVYAQYKVVGSGSTQVLHDTDGANNGWEYTGYHNSGIYKHRAAVEIAVLPDHYGDWVYPQ